MLNNMLRLKATAGSATHHSATPEVSELGLLTQQLFTKMLWLERKRTERSHRGFVLMLLDPGKLLDHGSNREKTLAKILTALAQSVRDTDITGWYKDGGILGVIFTEARHRRSGIAGEHPLDEGQRGPVPHIDGGSNQRNQIDISRLSGGLGRRQPIRPGPFESPCGSRAGLSSQDNCPPREALDGLCRQPRSNRPLPARLRRNSGSDQADIEGPRLSTGR